VLTKYWRRQNLGVDKMLAHAQKHLLTVFSWQSPQQLTSPRPRWCSPTSPWRCCTLHVQSPSVLLPLAALLSWADSLLHCTGLFVLARHAETSQIMASTKYRRPPRFHWFLPNYSSQYLCSQASYQKVVKAKSNHHRCPISVFVLMTSIPRPSQISNAEVSECSNGVGPGGRRRRGGRGGTVLLITSTWGRVVSKHALHLLLALNSTSCNFPSWSLFRLSLGCCETLSQ